MWVVPDFAGEARPPILHFSILIPYIMYILRAWVPACVGTTGRRDDFLPLLERPCHAGYNLPSMKIRDIGEFGVIEMLNGMVVGGRGGPDNASPFSFELRVDTGDDTAAWRTGAAIELFTTDTVVEGVHFTRETTPWLDLGWKCIASNVSDIAAMGGLPLYALVTLGLPPETDVDDLRLLYRGMLEICNRYGVSIIGGDMVRSPVAFITVGLTGVHDGEPMLRTGARVGDMVGVTGCLGDSGGGLRLMLAEQEISPLPLRVSADAADYLRWRHRRPEPAVTDGRTLAQAGVAAAMDVSDGLADDLGKLCKASGLAARIDAHRVPVHPYLSESFPDSFLELALYGGEDYLLLFTAPPATMDEVLPRLSPAAAAIGEIVPGEPGSVSIVDASGAPVSPGAGGWDHFR